MKPFVSIDLGLGASGYAYWRDDQLVQTGLVRSLPKTKGLNARIEEQRQAWDAILREVLRFGGLEFTVIERMKHYPVRRKRGQKVRHIPPQDLIDLSLVASVFPGPKYFVFASEWKGSIDRETEQSRSAAALKPYELYRVECVTPESLRKEAWSAVGIGLSLTKRAHLGFSLESLA